MSMEKNWYSRLLEAIEADPRSLKKISADIGHGVNYIQQMIKDEKEPGSDKLAKLLDTLGQEAALYVMTGVRMTQADLEFLTTFKSLPSAAQRRAVEFFQSLPASAGSSSPAPSDPESSSPKE